ncbi:MAG: sugar nucleotidyltransferase [Gammaproteobacteria bacterium]|nr:sugar nucleotidyltransferase [Gammaproteobacteria bacterium]|tara:strand:- start:1976 stop:2713 length:738 start_codon:yes stop_codon:yes gene_type:complete
MIKEAVILAAGMGTRLSDAMAGKPKGFIIFDRYPIIEESVRKLLKQGVEKIWIVTGYQPHNFENLIDKYPRSVQTIWNPEFENSGTMYSLYCARDYVKGSFLLLESDIIYEQKALSELINSPSEECILLSGFTQSGDEVFVETKDNCLVCMSKDQSQLGDKPSGELVGIVKLSPKLFFCMQQHAKDHFAHSLFYDYETEALVAAGKEIDIDCLVLEDLVWAEIDDEVHLQRAKDEIYPIIKSREQ